MHTRLAMTLPLVALFWLAILSDPDPAHAQSGTAMMVRLNGTPTRIGVLTSLDGGVVTATIVPGEPLMVTCQPDSTAHVNVASTCSATQTAATFCPPIVGGIDRFYVIPNGTTIAMIPSDAGAPISCAIFRLDQ